MLGSNVVESRVGGTVTLVVSSLAFADIHLHRLAMAFARRLGE
ncbi:hypothetical protein ACRN94_03010 [Shewanella baltica]